MNNNVKEINSAFQQYFRSSKRVRINSKSGVFVVADDKTEAVDLVQKLFVARGEDQKVVSSKNVSEAQDQILKHNIEDGVKAVIVDLGLEGKGKDADGLRLAKWLNQEFPDIPFVFSTGRSKRKSELERQFPGVDIFIKGTDNLGDLAEALGLNIIKEDEDNVCIPRDNGSTEETLGMFSFVRKLLTI